MSVGATTNIYTGVPGLATLGLGVTPPASAASATTPGGSVAGFSVLGLQGNGKSTTPAPSSSGPNVYQNAYSGIIAASNNYLQDALLNGAPSNLPLYAGGTTVNAFSGLNATLAALKTGLAAGFFQGTGFNALA